MNHLPLEIGNSVADILKIANGVLRNLRAKGV